MTQAEPTTAAGAFGAYGGVFVPETLHAALDQLDAAFQEARADAAFNERLEGLLEGFVGRPTPLYRASHLSPGPGQILLKREDLCHTGAHKINNALGQALLAERMGKPRIIAETGAGQHGVATATAAACFGLDCEIYMGETDMARQRPNVTRMELLGARVVPVTTGARTLKDATNAAMRDWMASSESTHYVIGSCVGPHPFPSMVSAFHEVIGRETRAQCLEQLGRLPDDLVACVGGGSNAAGLFKAFIDDAAVRMHGVEAGGRSRDLGDHAASISHGEPGVLHGSKSYVLQDESGQTAPVHSVSAGLDYPGVGPEHAHWHETGRVRYTAATDAEALEAFEATARCEGIIPALETAHALWEAQRLAAEGPADRVIVVNLSGRGDKDVDEAAKWLSARSEASRA